MTRNSRIGLLLAALVVAVVAVVVVGTGGDESDPPPPAATTTAPARPRPAPIPAIRLRDGRPVGGVRTLRFDGDERVRFAIASDVRRAIHVHGYDVERTVPAGGRVTFSFPARAQGVFEIESHDTGVEIGRLEVGP